MKKVARPVVVGAGLGGLIAAALLCRRGLRPLVLERLSFIGGKFTQFEFEGFQVPTGAFHALPGGSSGQLGRLFRSLGLRLRYHEPRPAGFFFDGAARLSLPFPLRCAFRRDSWLWSLSLRTRLQVARLLFTILKTRRPVPDVTLGDYVRTFTRDVRVLRGLDACMRYADGVRIERAAARDVVHALRVQDGHFQGVIRGGCKTVVDELRRFLEDHGGEIRTSCGVRRILVRNARPEAVVTEDAEEHETSLVVAGTPPRETQALLGAACPSRIASAVDNLRPAHGITHCMRSSASIIPHTGADFHAGLEARTAGCIQISNGDPSLAPAGMHFILAYQPLATDEDAECATRQGRDELMRLYPDLDEDSFFHTSIFQKTWPAAHIAQEFTQHGSHRLPVAFPELPNFFMLSHSCAGLGLAADIIGGAAEQLESALDKAHE